LLIQLILIIVNIAGLVFIKQFGIR